MTGLLVLTYLWAGLTVAWAYWQIVQISGALGRRLCARPRALIAIGLAWPVLPLLWLVIWYGEPRPAK